MACQSRIDDLVETSICFVLGSESEIQFVESMSEPHIRFVKRKPLVMTNSLPWYRWPIEIDGLPVKNGGSFHG